MASLKVIHCIGDSHACFFGGYDIIQPGYPEESRNKYPYFKCYRLGSILAYSLNKLNTKERGREKLLELVSELPYGANLLLCFGEIDCRCHLLKQSELQKKTLEKCVEDCVTNYFQVVDELINKGFSLMIWNVIPSAYSDNKEYPTYGTLEDRNKCTVVFNNYLEKECIKRSINFVSIYNKLLDRKGRTKFVYYFDSIHLGQVAMAFVIDNLYNIRKDVLGNYLSPIKIKTLLFTTTLLTGLMYFRKILSDFKRNLLNQFKNRINHNP